MNASFRASALACTIVVSLPAMAIAQSLRVTTEIDLTSGYSTTDTMGAAAAQVRVFGDTPSRIRFNVEGTWADRSSRETDAFGAAYPYGGRLQVSEAYGERTWARGATRTAVRVGQYRSPFGIFDRSDYAYSGLWRAPLMRYDGLWGVNNNFLERGADVAVGVPHASFEASVGTPGDIGTSKRRGGISSVVRAQAHVGDLTVGASHLSSASYDREIAQPGRLGFTSIDARWMRGGIQVRGEYLRGRPSAGTMTRGWVVESSAHRPFMGPVTAVFRTERFEHESPRPFTWMGMECLEEWYGARHTAGGRVRLPGGWTAQASAVFEGAELAEHGGRAALDIGVTYAFRR